MLKIEKFTDVCMTGGIMNTPSHSNGSIKVTVVLFALILKCLIR